MRVHAPSLHRLMRTLASLGLLTERTEQRFALTTLGEALKTGAPGSARSAVLALCSSWFASAFDHIVHSVQTGRTGFEKAHGMPIFDYLSQHSEDASLFSETMIGLHGADSRWQLLRPTIFLPSKPLSTWAVQPVTCWRRSSRSMPGLGACCSTGRMWYVTHPHCSKQRA